jgi:hypothetical protein
MIAPAALDQGDGARDDGALAGADSMQQPVDVGSPAQ